MKKYASLTAIAGLALVSSSANAADQYWSGTGNWGDSSWSSTSGGSYTNAWVDGNDAIFEGTAGTVNVAGTINVNNLHFATNSGYSIDGGTLNFGSGGAISNSYALANNTIASAITGSPAVNASDGAGYVGLKFAPTIGTQSLGIIKSPAENGSGDKGGVILGGNTIGNTATSVGFDPANQYGTLWKEGSGTWTVGGDINTGATRISEGTLVVNGTITSQYSGLFITGGTLSGDFSFFKNDRRASTDFVSGTTIAPGSGIGTVSFDWGTSGATTNAAHWTTAFRAGSSYEWGVGASSTDIVHIDDGRLVIEGITLKIADLGGTPDAADQFTVFTYGTLDSKNLSLGSVVFDTTDAANYDASGASLVDDGAGRIYLTGLTSTIPEPSSTALLGLGGLALILRRRK